MAKNTKQPKEYVIKNESPSFGVVRIVAIIIVFIVVMALSPMVNYRAYTRTATSVLPVNNAVDGSNLIIHNVSFDSYSNFQELLHSGFGILQNFSKAGETGFQLLFGNQYYLLCLDDGDRTRGFVVVGPFSGPKELVSSTEIIYSGGTVGNVSGGLTVYGQGWFLDPFYVNFSSETTKYYPKGFSFGNPYAAKSASAEILQSYGEAWVSNGTLPN